MHNFVGEIINCNGKTAKNLTNGHENNVFIFKQAETDSMLLTVSSKLIDSCERLAVVESEDTDVM